MIIKVKGAGNHHWWIFDNATEVSYGPVPTDGMPSDAEWQHHAALPQTHYDAPLLMFLHEGRVRKLVVDEAYLLNDSGDTIERVPAYHMLTGLEQPS